MTSPPPQDAPRLVSALALWRVFARSLLIMAGFNPRTMQGLGCAYAIAPALEALHPDARGLETALSRHLGFFNTHPYFAAAILGALVRIEERVASGLCPPERVAQLRDALCAPLAAIGDAFFWNALRPACALVAVLCAPALGLWSVLLFLVLYNAVHLSTRLWLFVAGYRHAEGVVAVIGRARFPVRTLWLRRAAAALAGVAAACTASYGFDLGGAARTSLVAGLSAGLLLSPRVGPYLLAALALLIGLAASLQ
jgi:PTS system mannose-specific IID component